MKKIVLFVLLTAAAGGILFAQTTQTAATINGTVGLSAGRIVVKNETATYYTRGLDRLVGFIDGFKDGAQVTMEGYVSAPLFGGETEKWLIAGFRDKIKAKNSPSKRIHRGSLKASKRYWGTTFI